MGEESGTTKVLAGNGVEIDYSIMDVAVEHGH